MSVEAPPSSVGCSELRTTSPRGLACLHCTQREAEAQSHVIVDILERSCLKNVALNYLVDGSFGNELDRIYEHIERLSLRGRQVFLELYLLNGPKQRRGGSLTLPPPEEFRSEIFTNTELRERYVAQVQSLVPLLRFAHSQGVVLFLVPMLEDNLTDEAFAELLELTFSGLPLDLPIAIGRNPCPGCYPGNETGLPAGVFEELHTSTPRKGLRARRFSGGVVTNDGYDPPSIEELVSLRDWADDSDSVFILWDAERQGLIWHSARRWTHLPASKRDYKTPDAAEQERIAAFLRGYP